jgi:hypothetical protein
MLATALHRQKKDCFVADSAIVAFKDSATSFAKQVDRASSDLRRRVAVQILLIAVRPALPGPLRHP